MNKLSKPFALVAIALAISACSSSTEKQEQPTPTSAITEEPSPEATSEETVQVPPIEGITINDDRLSDLPRVEGFTEEEVTGAVQSAQDFALVGLTTPIFYTGQWWDEDQEEIAALWSSVATEGVIDSIAILNPKLPEDGQVLSSIAPLYRAESENVSVIDLCADGWENCLSEDIVFSNLVVGVEEDDPRLQVSFNVDTSRLLDYRGEPAQSDISLEHTFWMIEDEAEWKVDAFSSSYEFGEVTSLSVSPADTDDEEGE